MVELAADTEEVVVADPKLVTVAATSVGSTAFAGSELPIGGSTESVAVDKTFPFMYIFNIFQ